MAAALPTPGQLVLENITLLLSSPSAFQERYGVSLTPTTFAKPGNSVEANAALHFLLGQIEPDVVEPLFKPCFPIRDREQERDFRRVVDSRLAILEKSKLLPVGASRKSVVASAGGDRFLDLLWSLSTLALQQACLRHPPYGPVTRLRMTSISSRPESLSHQSSARSNRSLLSVVSSRSERANPDPQPLRQRRFLGVGILSATQQRSRDAEQIRARIDAERHALHRTAELAQRGENTWASEAESLREKINHFEAKLARLKGQLADMGFDENGVDIRAKGQSLRPQSATPISSDVALTERNVDAGTSSSAISIRTSPSGDSIADEFKTSPIDSTESGSSVDELPEPSDGVTDIAADLTRLLAFTAETSQVRDRVDQTLRVEKPRFEATDTPGARSFGRSSEAADIVDLVRAATCELEEATNRMDEIQENQRRVVENVPDIGYATSDGKYGDSESESSGIRVASGDADTSISMITIVEEADVKEDEPQGSQPEVHATSDSQHAVSRTSSDQPNSIANLNSKVFPSVPNSSTSSNEEASKIIKVESDLAPNVVSVDKPSPDDNSLYNIDQDSDSVPCNNEQSSLGKLEATREATVLEALAVASTKRHQGVIEASEKLQKDAQEFSEKAVETGSRILEESFSSHVPSGVAESTDEKWLTEAVVRAMKDKESIDNTNPDTTVTEHTNDVQAASRAFRNSVTPIRLRKDQSSQSTDAINLSTAKTLELSPRYDTDVVVNPNALSSAGKSARSVRFAELPPSYSRSRGGVALRAGAIQDRLTRCATEVHPRSPRSAKPNTNISSTHIDNTDVKLKNTGSETKSKDDRQKGGVDKRRPESINNDVGTDGNRGSLGVSGQKPPRLQRRQTPHRILRQKEVIQRSVCLPPRTTTPRSIRQPVVVRPQSFDGSRSWDEEERKVRIVVDVSRSWDGESTKTSDLMESGIDTMKSNDNVKEHSVSPTTSSGYGYIDDVNDKSQAEKLSLSGDKNSKPDIEVEIGSPEEAKVETKTGISAVELKERDVGEDVENRSELDLKTSTRSREQSLDDLGDKVSVEDLAGESSDNLMGESSCNGWSSGIQRIGTHLQTSKPGSKRNGLLRISSVGMLGTFHGRSSSPSINSRENHVRDMFQSFDSADSILSSGGRSGSSRGLTGTRSSGGFFAGETAQWQENVRQLTPPRGEVNSTPGSSRSSRMSAEVSSRPLRGSGRPSVVSNTGNMRKSRVQSFRARLAALKRE